MIINYNIMYANLRLPITHGKIIHCLNSLINKRLIFQGFKCKTLITDHEYLINEKRIDNWSKRREQTTSSLVFYNFDNKEDIEGILDGSVDISRNITKGCGIHKVTPALRTEDWKENTVVCEVLREGLDGFDHMSYDKMFNVDAQLIYPKYFIKTKINKSNENYGLFDRCMMQFEENHRVFYEIDEDDDDIFLKNII
jgi:hypothetical protein